MASPTNGPAPSGGGYNAKFRKAVQIMDEFRISQDVMSQVDKTHWIELIDLHETICEYAVVGGRLDHWKIIAKTNNDVYVQTELLADSGKEITYDLHETIKTRNSNGFQLTAQYIYPRFVMFHDPPPDAPKMKKCTVEWNRFVVSVAMDEQVYKVYGSAINNCQQWCQRVCNRIGLSTSITPMLSEGPADFSRNISESKSPGSNKNNTPAPAPTPQPATNNATAGPSASGAGVDAAIGDDRRSGSSGSGSSCVVC